MKKKVSALLFLVFTLMISVLTGCGKQTAKFPNKPIEMVIPFGAGGASDIFARRYADIVKDELGVPVTAVNKPGSGTVAGMAYAIGMPADGYTVLEITPSVLIKDVTGEFQFTKFFDPLIKVQNDLMLFGVSKNSPFNTIEDLIKYAKENPGKLKIGGLSPGGLDDYIANGFSQKAGFNWTYVPYKSGSEIKSAVLGGELDVYQDKLSSFLPMVESGDIKPLIVLSNTRVDSPIMADVPTSIEKGIDFIQGSWRGFAIAKGVPTEERQILIDAFTKAYSDPRYAELEKQTKTNFSVGYLPPEEQLADWNKEKAGLTTTFKAMGIIDENGKLANTEVKGDVLGATGFPLFILYLSIICLVLIVFKSYKKAGSFGAIFSSLDKPDVGMASTVICIGAYIALMNLVGFILSTILFTFCNARFMGYKNTKVLVIFSLIMTTLVVMVFGNLFTVPLPRGMGMFRDLSYLIY